MGTQTRSSIRLRAVPGILAAVLLALTFGSISQPSAARAAPQVVSVEYRLFVAPQGTITVCAGQTKKFYVTISQVVTRRVGTYEYEVSSQLAGEDITGTVGSPTIGSLSPTTQNSRWQGGSTQVEFTFKGAKRGLTTITFSHTALTPLVGGNAIAPAADVTVRVQVKKCRFRVRTHWSGLIPDGFRPSMVASMDNAELIADANGVYTGMGPVNSVARPTLFVGCSVTMSVSPSTATLSGQFDNNDGLNLDIGYESVLASTRATCIRPSGGNSENAKLDPILLNMPASGGVTTRPQVLAAYMRVTGSSTIVVNRIFEP